ncbi:HRDC domain-containing protein [Corynebacterium striatum]
MTELRTQPQDGIPEVLRSPAEFASATTALSAGTGPFAIDTERASSYRFDDRAFLSQIRRAGAGTFLFAPEGKRSELSAALAPVINDQDWVVHAAPSDLPSLAWLGLYPGTLFDTELAARMADFAHPNLGAMILELFDVELEKGYGDSDWSAPKLSPNLRAYAALDVELLLELAEALRDILAEEDKLDWAYEEFAAMVDDYAGVTEPTERTWRGLKGLSSLRTGEQLAVAKALWTRRESIARSTDTAPNRVLPHRVLIDIARTLPDSPQQFARIKGIPRKRSGSALQWFDVVNKARALDPQDWPRQQRTISQVPSKTIWAKDYPELWEVFQNLREECEDLGDEVAMPWELILKPATLRAVVWAAGCPPKAKKPGSVGGMIKGPQDIAPFLRDEGVREWQIELLQPILEEGLVYAG